MRQYTKAEVDRIMLGLTSGTRPGYIPPTDAEFEAQYDPQRYRHEQLIEALNRLIETLNAFSADSREQTPHQYSIPLTPFSTARGPVDL